MKALIGVEMNKCAGVQKDMTAYSSETVDKSKQKTHWHEKNGSYKFVNQLGLNV